jgi:polyhydroxyalkanoate synthesis regulator protein
VLNHGRRTSDTQIRQPAALRRAGQPSRDLDDLRNSSPPASASRSHDKSNEDLTRILPQIIASQEQFGTLVLSTQLLEAIIRFYGNPIQQLLTSYRAASAGCGSRI